MSQTSMYQDQARRDLWQALKDLHFVTDFFSWLFALFSRLAEPLMLLCTLYIVAEAGVPSIALPALHNLAIGIMICAPEIILPGSFVVASRAQEHARLLFAVCWTFVALTLLTLISLFVWHFAGASLAWLMCARCAAAVGYSILMRVMSHGQPGQPTIPVPDVLAKLEEVSGTIVHTASNTEHRIAAHLQRIDVNTTPIANSQMVTVRGTSANKRIARSAMQDLWKHDLTTTSTLDEREHKTPPVRTSTHQKIAIDAPIALRANANTKRKQGEQGSTIEQRVRSTLANHPNLSDRELAAIVGVSPSTANKWRKRIEQSAA